MYEQHFGLRKPLFDSGIAQDGAVFLDEAQRAAMRHVSIALTSHDSALLLCGPAGVGKTTFAATAIRTSSSSTRMASTWLSNAPLTPNELLELLLAEFGFDPYKHSRVERLQIWRQFLTELGATDTRIFIAVEQADNVPPVVLHALASLTVADPNGCPGANLVLMGQDGLIELLNTPCLKELKQRVRLMRRFEPLSDEGVEAYLEHSVAMAAGDHTRVFAPKSIPALRAYSGGIPRVLNNLCDTALALAAAGGEPNVTAALVTRAAVELCGMKPLLHVDCSDPGNEAAAESPKAAEAEAEERVAGAGLDEIPVLTESVEIDLGSGEYEAVLSQDLLDCETAGLEEEALAWDAGATLELTFAQHDFASLLSTASRADDESGDYAVDPRASEPAAVLTAATASPDDVDLDDLTAELAEAILSADPPDDLDYADFPEVPAARNTDAVAPDSADTAPADAVDPRRISA